MKLVSKTIIVSLLTIALFAGGFINYFQNADASKAQTILSPKQQMAHGTAAKDVICKAGLTLMIKTSNGKPACVKPTTAAKLSKGWGSIVKEFPVQENIGSRPNILIIELDDTGFSDLSFTGSEINTPVMQSLAKEGFVLTNYHTLPTCSPTRAELLTGVDNHQNGIGTMSEMMADNQKGKSGYEGYMNYDVVTVADLLKDSSYHTYMAGKWHLSYGMGNVTGELDKWAKYDPYARGFEETFSGNMPGNHFNEMGASQSHQPIYTRNGERVHLPDNWYSSDGYTDYMIQFMDKNHGDGKPMFMYLAYWANHWPIQAPQEYIKKYDGVYDKGWDAIRQERFDKQKELGLIPKETQLPPRLASVPAWTDLTPEQQKYEAKKMQVFAAMMDRMDYNIGRVIEHLKEIGEYDNTIILISSDNGAEGTDVLKKVKHGDDPELYKEWLAKNFDNSLENLGSKTSHISLGLAWSQVGSTPLFREKGFLTEGGIRVPMIVKLPHNSANVNTNALSTDLDITPTILDYANVKHPGDNYNGRNIHTLVGKSLRPLFEGKTDKIHGDDEAISRELFGNEAVFKGDWKALRLVPPFGDGQWKLYNLADDMFEQNDLSGEHPELLEELKQDYANYAKNVGVVAPIGLEIPRDAEPDQEEGD